MCRSLNVVLAMGVLFALVTLTGSAFAQVPDGEWRIVSKRSEGTTAQVDFSGDAYALEVEVVCGEFVDESDAEKGSAVLLDSDHPDKTELKKKQAKVEQSRSGNPVRVRFLTGSGRARTTNTLACDKARAEAKVKTKKSPTGSFEAFVKKCTCLEAESQNCEIFGDQIEMFGKDCENNKTIFGSFKDGAVNKIRLKGKGDATPLN
jgi:hypothetical protein